MKAAVAAIRRALPAFLLVLLLASCGRPSAPASEGSAGPTGPERISATEAAHLERTFDEIMDTLEEGYVYGALRQVDWKALRTEFRGKLSEVGSVAGLSDVVEAMLAKLGEPDIVWQSREERIRAELEYSTRYDGIGTYIAFRESPVPRVVILEVMPGSPAERSGLLPHDAILSIDGSPVLAGEGATVAQRIRGPRGTEVRILVKRPGSAAREMRVTRAPVDLSNVVYPVRWGFIGESSVGFILLPRSAEADLAERVPSAVEELAARRRLDGLVLDLRISGAGSFPLVELLTLFGNGRLGVTYTAGESQEIEIQGSDRSGSQSIKLALLVGPETEGAAEIFAAALQSSKRAIVVGAATPGAVERDQQTGLVDGSRLWMPVWSYRTEEGREVGREGVRPDVAVSAEWDSVSDSVDPVRAAAARALGGGGRP